MRFRYKIIEDFDQTVGRLPNGQPVYIDRLKSVDLFFDRNDYKFPFLAPFLILLSFSSLILLPFFAENPRNLISYRRSSHLGCKTLIFGLYSSYSLRLRLKCSFFSLQGRFSASLVIFLHFLLFFSTHSLFGYVLLVFFPL